MANDADVDPRASRALLALGIAIGAVCFFFAALQLGGDTMAPGWSLARTGDRMRVTAVERYGPADGLLQIGDAVEAINGLPLAGRGIGLVALMDLRDGDRYPIALDRGGISIDAVLPMRRLVDRDRLWFRTLPLFLVALTFFSSGCLVGFKRPGDRIGRLYMLLAMLVGITLLPFGVFSGELSHGFFRGVLAFSRVASPLMFATGFQFFRLFPPGIQQGRLWRALGLALVGWGALLVPAAVATAAAITRPAAEASRILSANAEWFTRYDTVSSTFILASFVASVAVIVRNHVVVTDPDQRRTLKWVTLGLLAGTSPMLLVFAWSAASEAMTGQGIELDSWIRAQGIAAIFLLFLPATFAFSIVRDRYETERLAQAAARSALALDIARLRDRVESAEQERVDVLSRVDPTVNLLKECPRCGRCYDRGQERCDDDQTLLMHPIGVERTIHRRYRLDQLLGRGGMGAVYSARDLQLERTVAIKLMTSVDANRRRFELEARALARLNHPHIVSIYDFGGVGSDVAFLVMEQLRGETLRQTLRRTGTMTPATVASWLDPIAKGVAAAHAAGMIHRDLKPENVFFADENGRPLPKLLDFGLAKLTGADLTTSLSLTEPGHIMGTLAYMSPEQLEGKAIDERTDVFSMGVMIIEALTGINPFRRDDTASTIAALLNESVSVVGDGLEVDRLDTAIQKSIAKTAGDRYSGVTSMGEALVAALSACPAGTICRLSRSDRPHR